MHGLLLLTHLRLHKLGNLVISKTKFTKSDPDRRLPIIGWIPLRDVQLVGIAQLSRQPQKTMTKLPLICTLLLGLFVVTAQTGYSQATVQSVYAEGVKLFNQQKYEEALTNFERILQVKANHVYARNYATKCKNAIAKGVGPKNDLEGQLAKIIIPNINLKDAPVGDVLDYLASRAEELTGGKMVPNFIYKGTNEQRDNTMITLNMRGVPMTQAIKYVGQLSRSRVRYEEHAVVIDPSAGSNPTTGPSAEDEFLKKAEEAAAGRANPFLNQPEKKSVFE